MNISTFIMISYPNYLLSKEDLIARRGLNQRQQLYLVLFWNLYKNRVNYKKNQILVLVDKESILKENYSRKSQSLIVYNKKKDKIMNYNKTQKI